MIKEITSAFKVLVVFAIVSILALFTSCENPTRSIDGVDGVSTVSIYLTNHVSYDTVTVLNNGKEWAVYEVLLNTSYFSEEDHMMHYERHDTVQISVPNRDEVTIVTHSMMGEFQNVIQVVKDSVYILSID